MPLKGKYLKFNDSITYEIFEDIYNTLIFNGWKNVHEIKSAWSEFSTNWKYLCDAGGNKCNQHSEKYMNGQTETTVQEILGYDPFVKEVIEKVIPEYVECVKPEFWVNTIKENNGNLIFDTKNFKFSYYSNTWKHAVGNYSHFKPSTKEAFDAQNKPKSIEKWSVGTYVLFLKDLMHVKAGYIDVINKSLDKDGCIYLEKYLTLDTGREKQDVVKWFATKSEAEKFAKTLVEPVKCGNGILDAVEPKQTLKQAVHCKAQEEWDFAKVLIGKIDGVIISKYDKISCCLNLNGETRASLDYYKSNNFQVLSFQEWCDSNGYKMEKEVKFEVGKWYKLNNCWWAKFHSLKGNSFYMSELITADLKYEKRNPESLANTDLDLNNTIVLASIEEIQQYLPDNHVDKITPVIQQARDMQKANQEFKVGDFVIVTDEILKSAWARKKESVGYVMQIPKSIYDIQGFNNGDATSGICPTNRFGINYEKKWIRHATPEEINNHLISIGQIPAGEPLNTGIEPNKDGAFEYKLTSPGSSWSGLTPTNDLDAMYFGDIMGKPIKPKMILSIDDEELPMINIIKTNSIKQLLNND